ncbi:hypothetical protein [Aeromicrobium sp. 179-A 4D2 NHS]|uniref:hypothetical protein n=1 Tax=Aeromicrobium sp. 179-A 4D2 NHS TaxID=3142375 RepID=UPI0039A22F75
MKPIELPDALADQIIAASDASAPDPSWAWALIEQMANLIEASPEPTVQWALKAPGSDHPFEHTYNHQPTVADGSPLVPVFRHVLDWHETERENA